MDFIFPPSPPPVIPIQSPLPPPVIPIQTPPYRDDVEIYYHVINNIILCSKKKKTQKKINEYK